VGTQRDPLRLAGGLAAATAILIGSITWAYAALGLMALVDGDICLESTCGDPDPALSIGLGVPAAVGVLAALALCVRLVGACARPAPERWKNVRRAAALSAASLAIWAGVIAVLAFA
jgi:hypothetical protein